MNMRIYGNLMNRIAESSAMPVPSVGMGATETCYSDRHAGTIVWVSKTGKTLRWKRDSATRINRRDISENQDYTYLPNPDSAEVTFRKNKSGWRNTAGNGLVNGERDEYYDFSF